MTTMTYNPKRHQQALDQHARFWDQMRAVRRQEGTDSGAYRQARADMVAAHRVVQWEARALKRGGR